MLSALRRRKLTTRLPTFVVIGTMKGGTSSLHRYLGEHPEVSMSTVKETNFLTGRTDHDLDWYIEQFDESAPARGESSPNYSKRQSFTGVPERMDQLLPGARLVYLVRDPVERALSNVAHAVRKGRLERADADLVFEPVDGEVGRLAPQSDYYVQTSRYHWQLQAYLEHYDLDDVLVVASEDLRSDRRAALRRVFTHVGVDPDFDSPSFDTEHHVTGRTRMDRQADEPVTTPTMSDSARASLVAALADDVAQLRTLTGQPFDAWQL